MNINIVLPSFEVGQRVRATKNSLEGKRGVVWEVAGNGAFVLFDDDRCPVWCTEDELELEEKF